MLYLMHKGKVEEALQKYEKIVQEEGREDFALLEQMALMLLEKGIESEDPEIQLLTTFGAGLSGQEKSINILRKSLFSPHLQIQLVAIYFLSQIPCQQSDQLLIAAMSSDYLITRLEASYALAQRRHPQAASYIEGLMTRLPPFFKPFFPPLFALAGDHDSIQKLKQLLEDPSSQVAIEAIHSLIQFERDDFLPHLRKKLTHENLAEKEACAYALGKLQDSESIPFLQKIAYKHHQENVRLAAYKALYSLGEASAKRAIEKLARKSNLFAIQALADIPQTEATLYFLLFSQEGQVAANAAISLWKKGDTKGLSLLTDLLIPRRKDLFLLPISSLGRAHHAFKVVSSSFLENQAEAEQLYNLSLHLREQLLKETSYLSEDIFFSVLHPIFEKEQNDLVPLAIHLLENLNTPSAIAFLKKEAQKWGSPLIRSYCNLALYRLQEEGPYAKYVYQWMEENKEALLIRLRPYLPSTERKYLSQYTLSAEETSQLLLESFSALARKQDPKSIHMVLEMIKNPSSKNRYVLAGLLLQAVN